ncbi:MAG: hypothetical protein U0350_04685 [Caldilineaceae bacterium]
MFQVLYECEKTWPQEGSLRVETPHLVVETPVSPDSARRRANRYLGTYVAMALRADNPMLVLENDQPIWRMSMDLHLQALGKVATMGAIEVNALTREVIPLTQVQIKQIHERANAIVSRLTPQTTPAI